MKLRPMNGRIIVRPDKAPEKVQGGIIIPESAQERPATGIVEAVAPGVEVNVGDHVAYARYVGIEHQIDGVDYLMLGQEDLVGILEEE